MASAIKAALRAGFVFAAAAAGGVLFVGGLWSLYGDTIGAARDSHIRGLARETLQNIEHDNAPVLEQHAADLPSARVAAAACARKNNTPAAIVARAVAKDGYNGDIDLIIAFAVNEGVAGVRVLRHRETPGIADFLDDENGAQQSLDGVAGATITSEAMRAAVADLLKWSGAQQGALRADVCQTQNNNG